MRTLTENVNRDTHLRTAANGAVVRDRLRLVSERGGYCGIGSELATLLWPGFENEERPRKPVLACEDGPTVEVSWSARARYDVGYMSGPYTVVRLPTSFWHWWDTQRRRGADELLVHCEDGESGRYTAQATQAATLHPDDVEAANEAARRIAAEVLQESEGGLPFHDFLSRLLAGGVFHQPVAPASLAAILLLPYPRFSMLRPETVEYRPDLTLELVRAFSGRFIFPWGMYEQYVREELKLPVSNDPAEVEIQVRSALPAAISLWADPPPPATGAELVNAVRLTVEAEGHRGVSRTIEVREDQTLEDLDDAIQDAFDWSDDGIFAFYLSGRAWDEVTEVRQPTLWDEFAIMSPDTVVIGDLGLTPRQQFLYVSDPQRDHRFPITVDAIGPAGDGDYPRLVKSAGHAPKLAPSLADVWQNDGSIDGMGLWGDDDFDAGDLDLAGLGAPALPSQPFPGLIPGGDPSSPFAPYPPFDEPLPQVFQELAEAIGLIRADLNDLSRLDLPEPDPSLRRLPIDLNTLADSFQGSATSPAYLDAERGDILIVPAATTPEVRLLRETIAAAPHRYSPVPAGTSTQSVEDMARFAETVDDPHLSEQLRLALRSKRPESRFFRALARDPAELERWDTETDRDLVTQMLHWLAEHGIYPDPPPPPEPAATSHKRKDSKKPTPDSKRAEKRRKH